MIHILFVSFVAGMITVLAPCVLPVLPVILGGSLADQDKYRPRVIILSFACSILLFTLTLQWLVWTLWIQKNDLVMVSGVILGLFGLSLVFPQAREYFADRSGINRITRYTARSKHQGYIPDIILGLVLGPVFNTCSPTYSILVATILPVSFLWWLTNMIVSDVGFDCDRMKIYYKQTQTHCGSSRLVQKNRRNHVDCGRYSYCYQNWQSNRILAYRSMIHHQYYITRSTTDQTYH